MAQLTVRKVDPEIVRRLRMRAAERGRSAEAEHRVILEQALRPGDAAFWAKAKALRERLADRRFDDSAKILRKLRRSGLRRRP